MTIRPSLLAELDQRWRIVLATDPTPATRRPRAPQRRPASPSWWTPDRAAWAVMLAPVAGIGLAVLAGLAALVAAIA